MRKVIWITVATTFWATASAQAQQYLPPPSMPGALDATMPGYPGYGSARPGASAPMPMTPPPGYSHLPPFGVMPPPPGYPPAPPGMGMPGPMPPYAPMPGRAPYPPGAPHGMLPPYVPTSPGHGPLPIAPLPIAPPPGFHPGPATEHGLLHPEHSPGPAAPCEPYSVYQPVGHAVPLSEPIAVYEGKRYSSVMKVECSCAWVQLSYLHAWIRPDRTPPLLTTGVLGAPGTTTLYGGDTGPDQFRGMATTIGIWLDPEQYTAIEFGGFWLGRNSSARTISSVNGVPTINLAVLTPGEGVIVLTSPTVASGTINIRDRFSAYGAELNLSQNWCRLKGFTFDTFVGFRHLYIDDLLAIDQSLTSRGGLIVNGTTLAAGTTAQINDTFQAANRFWGGQVGVRGSVILGPFESTVIGKLAAGATRHMIDIQGASTVPALGVSTNTGLLVQSTNRGRYSECDFSLVPEVTLQLSYAVAPNVRLFGSYSYLYWTNVTRAGDQIDRSTTPVFPDRLSNFYMHSLNVGIEWRF